MSIYYHPHHEDFTYIDNKTRNFFFLRRKVKIKDLSLWIVKYNGSIRYRGYYIYQYSMMSKTDPLYLHSKTLGL